MVSSEGTPVGNWGDKMQVTLRNRLYKLLILMIVPYLLVDSINGVMVRAELPSISLPYKLAVLFMILFWIGRFSLPVMLSLMAAPVIVVLTVTAGNLLTVFQDSLFLLKFLSIIVFTLFFSRVVRMGDRHRIIQLALVSFLIIGINLVLGALGIGYPQYQGAHGMPIGSRGFFYSGNELAGLLVITTAILQMHLLRRGRYGRFLLVGLLAAGCSGLATSKVTLLAIFLILATFPVIHGWQLKQKGGSGPREKRFFWLMLVLVPGLAMGGTCFALFGMKLYDRLAHNLQHMDTLNFILSNRNVWASQAVTVLQQDYGPVQWLFGTGSHWRSGIYANKIVEIDPLDILMMYGIWGVTLVYGFFAGLISRSVRRFRSNPDAIYVAFTLVLLMGISCTAGHVVYSGVMAPLIGALGALAVGRTSGEERTRRMLLVSNMFPSSSQPYFGVFVRNFARAMDQREFIVDTAVIRGQGTTRLSKLAKYVRLMFCTGIKLLFRSYDVVYVHFLNHSLLAMLPAMPFISLPLVGNAHGSDLFPVTPLSARLQRWTGRFLQQLDLLVVPSPFFRENLPVSVTGGGVSVSPSGGVDPGLFQPAITGKPSGPFTIGFVSRITTGKGWDVLLRAMKCLRETENVPPWQLLVVGNGNQRQDMVALAEQFHLAERVRMMDAVSQEELPDLYRRFHLLVFPTMRQMESLGLVALEAMACGTPVVGSRAGALPGYIQHGESGFLFEPGDHEQLAEQVRQFMLLSDARRQEMSRAAVEAARPFSSGPVYDELAVQIREVCG